jgi:NTE family protein
VAIACQGGANRAAFGAGALLHLLEPEQQSRFKLVALSGTSGGALSAALVWRGLVSSGPEEAGKRLLGFWRGLVPQDPTDVVASVLDVLLASFPVVTNATPYLARPFAEARLRTLLHTHLELESLTTDRALRARLPLFVGATDVLNGDRVVFSGEKLSYEQLLASGAAPPLLSGIQIDGHLCWDGIFTTNPPIREFTDLFDPPDEIWVIQVNPQRRYHEPRSVREIKDRSNELSGNLSLGQELYFIDRINRLLETHHALTDKYKPIKVRVIELGAEDLEWPAKLNRGLIERLIERGRIEAECFFDARSHWPRERTAPARATFV